MTPLSRELYLDLTRLTVTEIRSRWQHRRADFEKVYESNMLRRSILTPYRQIIFGDTEVKS